MKRFISMILVAVILITAIPVQCFAANETLIEVGVDNAPLRAANNKNGKVVARCKLGAVLISTGTKKNIKGNTWYKVKYNDETVYIYSGNVKKHNHAYEIIKYEGKTYHVCDCGNILVETKGKKVALNSYALCLAGAFSSEAVASYAPGFLGYAEVAGLTAVADGPAPIGDFIGAAILIAGTVAMVEQYTNSKLDAYEAIETISLLEFAAENVCTPYSYRLVQRIGGKLKYIDNQCLDIVQAYLFCRFANLDVYAKDYLTALDLAMMDENYFGPERDKNKADYYYHFHYGLEKTKYRDRITIGGHIFYGKTENGSTPTY